MNKTTCCNQCGQPGLEKRTSHRVETKTGSFYACTYVKGKDGVRRRPDLHDAQLANGLEI